MLVRRTARPCVGRPIMANAATRALPPPWSLPRAVPQPQDVFVIEAIMAQPPARRKTTSIEEWKGDWAVLRAGQLAVLSNHLRAGAWIWRSERRRWHKCKTLAPRARKADHPFIGVRSTAPERPEIWRWFVHAGLTRFASTGIIDCSNVGPYWRGRRGKEVIR